ncbi:MAG: HEPN domain-containing protein [bacterium]
MDREDLIAYWINSSDKDFKTMQHLFKTKDYHWCLFLGHLVIEKLLKAYFVKTVDLQPPFIHDLLRLASKSKLELSQEQKDTLDIVSTFNISARYDDYKLQFYKQCSKEYTEKWHKKIKDFRTWIKKQLSES